MLRKERRELLDRVSALEKQALIDQTLLFDMSEQLDMANRSLEYARQDAMDHLAEDQIICERLIRVHEQLCSISVRTTPLADLAKE